MWCIGKKIHLSVAHVPGVENTEADEEFRTINDDTKWSLSPNVFEAIREAFPQLSVYLFASRTNYKIKKFVSRRPDPEAYAIDAFTMSWTNEVFYMFPPFSLIGRILQKVQEDKTTAVLVAPIWTTQSWWPSLLSLICGKCYQVRKTKQNLHLPHDRDREYPIKRMNLGVFCISGGNSKTKEFKREPETSYYSLGETARNNSTTHILPNGWISPIQKELIPFNPNWDTF